MDIYRVGGAVRDRLLGRDSQDNDWVIVGATAEQLLNQGFTQVGKDFPVFLHPKTQEEYALARTERKTHKGYKGFAVTADNSVTLEQDLQRRDLTINAMAETTDGQLIDPYGGYQDLQAGILRHVSPAFAEDPVRILRVARFAARYNFTIARETHALMCDMVQQGEVNALVPERVWQETEKALSEPYCWRFVTVLRDCGALAVLFPELDRLFGVPQPATYHPEIDTGEHILLALQQARQLTEDSVIIFAVLTHDLGKGITDPTQWPHHYGHEQLGVNLIIQLCKRFKIPKAHEELAKLVAEYHTHCHQLLQLNPKTILKTLLAVDAIRRPHRFEQFLQACEADARGRTGFEARDYPQARLFASALKTLQTVDYHDLLEKELQGKLFAEALHKKRLQALVDWRNSV
ncbi:multifunctional CCA addition/repair protein [Thioflexithrix psekupsensis]|uniref:Multifunctional CCA protein n=1 Tax=Thioflexithrix psekupsensis TaxID=1570016 RepID=A0A251X9X4_9GAMM|nr:multifunctional CCA addition/repair protein [Thioflexithrix psekupsensis]OUD14984.1 multifunctional CCA tRNA nucleotidyl transferase/2'3'-cyclic phosphodiesterase/2'nucleotidase/phosphatase [Thioflexithrix psekupsensis]